MCIFEEETSHLIFYLSPKLLILCLFFSSKQKIFIEYIMLDGVNDEEQHAHQLGKLLDRFQVVKSIVKLTVRH